MYECVNFSFCFARCFQPSRLRARRPELLLIGALGRYDPTKASGKNFICPVCRSHPSLGYSKNNQKRKIYALKLQNAVGFCGLLPPPSVYPPLAVPFIRCFASTVLNSMPVFYLCILLDNRFFGNLAVLNKTFPIICFDARL